MVRLLDGGELVDWAGKRVVVLGLARQGKALARFLAEHGAEVTVSDLKTATEIADSTQELEDLDLRFVFGSHPPELVEGADLLCLSGGVPAGLPLAEQAREKGIRVTNDAQIFLETSSAPSIGITGSAGKSTVTALVGRMAAAGLEPLGHTAWVGGNIGRPLIADVDRMGPADLAVIELSSFQLELMTLSPHVAAVLNITPNHLDRHGTMQAYIAAKRRILEFQTADDVAVLGSEDPTAWDLRSDVRGRLVSFGWSLEAGEGAYLAGDSIRVDWDAHTITVCKIDAVRLRGRHNLLNVLAACAIGTAAGLSSDALEAGIRGFTGLPHRLELVRQVGGVQWVNDSIATAPERAIAAIQSFDEPLVLLAGGRDKDLPWDRLAALIVERVDHLVVFGEAADKVERAVEARGPSSRPLTLDRAPDLESAVRAADRVAERGDVVLLAPGGTSFDEFRDFEARGEKFRALVDAL
jgi:UDP-N-acetylmuramoylalanine--D-glutamate ligase